MVFLLFVESPNELDLKIDWKIYRHEDKFTDLDIAMDTHGVKLSIKHHMDSIATDSPFSLPAQTVVHANQHQDVTVTYVSRHTGKHLQYIVGTVTSPAAESTGSLPDLKLFLQGEILRPAVELATGKPKMLCPLSQAKGATTVISIANRLKATLPLKLRVEPAPFRILSCKYAAHSDRGKQLKASLWSPEVL